ncbi:hypothetical protein CMI38_02495 [Candidatus Pacearchaeota archaeon]|nr:hypothetical protein [Candidatus Pacearchaeota archaeon]|tara:strand:+ start:9 stop:428 length:420 start_codon:yes stop_codon:yes gene_type:complete
MNSTNNLELEEQIDSPTFTSRTKSTQHLNAKISIDGTEYEVFCEYETEKIENDPNRSRDTRKLSASLPEYQPENRARGLYASFERDQIINYDHKGVYGHNQEVNSNDHYLQKIFEEKVEPHLRRMLPDHIKDMLEISIN